MTVRRGTAELERRQRNMAEQRAGLGRVATYLTFYRKKANETAFTQMGSGKITGSWGASSSTCYRISSGMTYVIAPHSASGWDTWRVAVGTKLRTTWQEVRATGQQYIEPPA